jgi:F-type H+-transporting ATPase subunit gamma
MPNLKDIKSRIQSVQNTQKITRAMKMVAAAKVKKSENAVKSARPFADELVTLFGRLLAVVGNNISAEGAKFKTELENYPELLKRRDVKTVGFLVVTSNKGLAGAYNANIVRLVLREVEEYKQKGINVKMYIVGQKGVSALKRKAEDFGFEIVQKYIEVANDASSSGANLIAEDIAKSFVNKEIDSIRIFTTKFKNMMSYTAQKWELLPLTLPEVAEKSSIEPIMLFEPDESAILKQIVPMYVTNTIYQALLEAQASELASRMTAMSAASKNAEEMIRLLTIDYNKARQWAITQEIIEVAAGANALNG